MTIDLIKTLIPLLPRFAEEEGDYYAVKRTDLIMSLCQQTGIETAIAENTVNLCEILLDSLATLKRDLLKQGEWCFVSFPAQLMALSVLTAMSDPDSSFFDNDFWNTHTVDNAKKEQQRAVLNLIENKRLAVHLNQAATPIRYIYVAWSIIKCDGKVLFHQREDTLKRHEQSAGDYGLVGGRVNQRDLDYFTGSMVEKLRVLQSNQRDKIAPALSETLKRELLEEVGLVYEQHYTFKPWRSLKPYQQVQGAAPNHALTEYFLDIYSIDLTLEGFCYLQQAGEKNERLVWFSVDELVSGKKSDGKSVYIRALCDDFDGDKEALKHELLNLGESFSANYLVNKNNYGITLSGNMHSPLIIGQLGKEKALDVTLTQEQLDLLLALAGHGRGFTLSSLKDGIGLHAYGWIEVQNESDLLDALIELSGMQIEPLLVENEKDRFFRLSINPECLFFTDSFFNFSVKADDLNNSKSRVPLRIQRLAIKTALGTINAVDKQREIPISIAKGLLAIQSSSGNDSQLDTYKKAIHKEVMQLGMRGLVRKDAGEIKLYGTFNIVE